MNKFEMKRELVPQEGEEGLFQPFSVNTEKNEVERTVIMSLDCGSTQTRVMSYTQGVDIFDDDIFEEVSEDITCVPAVIKSADGLSTFDSISNNIVDNLEIHIQDVTSNKEKKVFTEVKLVRGSLVNDSMGIETKLLPTEAKINQEQFYKILLSGLATRLIVKASTDGLAQVYTPIFTVALPPQESENPIDKERFLNNIAGEYKFNFPRLNVTFTLIVKKENVFVKNEPQLAYQAVAGEDEALDAKYALHLDGGGKSIGVAPIINHQIARQAAITLDYAGSNLIQEIGLEYQKRNGGSVPPMKSMEEALKTGYYRIGRKSIDISAVVEHCKREFAKRILNDVYSRVFSRLESVTSEMIEVISASGRMFRDDNDNFIGTEVPARSVMSYFMDLYQEKNIGTEFVLIDTDNPIVYGGLLNTISEVQKNRTEEVEEVIESKPVVENVQPVSVASETTETLEIYPQN